MGQLTFLCEKGDESLVWDREDVNQVNDAEKKFEKWKAKGYKMFTVQKGGWGKKKQTPIETFDPQAEEILVIQTTKKG